MTTPDGGPPDATLDAAVDAPPAPDATVDASPATKCDECLELPPFVPMSPMDPLAVAPKVLWSRPMGVTGFGPLVATKATVALSTSFGLVFLEPADGSVKTFLSGANFEYVMDAALDAFGNAYFTGDHVYSAYPDGSGRWAKPLGPAGQRSGPFVIAPSGRLFYYGGQNILVSRRVEDGEIVFARAAETPGTPYLAAGFRHYVIETDQSRSIAHDISDGRTIECSYDIQGVPMAHSFPVFGGELVYRRVTPLRPAFSNHEVSLVDGCHRVLWTLGARRAQTAALVTPAGPTVLMSDILGDGAMAELRLIDRDGHQVGNTIVSGRPLLAGADGVIYTRICDPSSGTEPARIVALSPSLEELWSLTIGGCPDYGAVLLASGVLMLSWETVRAEEYGVNVTAIQTTSPGLAKTSWPGMRGNNELSYWLE